MISYFEKQMKEIEHALQTLDEEAFERMVETAVDIL